MLKISFFSCLTAISLCGVHLEAAILKSSSSSKNQSSHANDGKATSPSHPADINNQYGAPEKTERKPPPTEVDYNKSFLTGDWGGWRPWLVDKGININSSFVSVIQGNPIGGLQQRAAHADSYGLSLEADMEKLADVSGLKFFISIVVRSGTNLSTTIGNQFPVAQDFGGSTYRLNEMYLKESLFEDHFHFKIGRLDGGNDFFQSPLYYNFISNAFDGNPISIFFNTTFSAYPVATWGAYLDVKVKRVLAKFAVYNPNPQVNKNSNHGLDFSLGNYGVLLISEISYQLNQEPDDEGLPGNYRFGAYYASAPTANFRGGATRGDYGYYYLFDQVLYRENKPGTTLDTDGSLTAFTTLLFAPENRNLFPFFTTTGLIYKGLFSCRPKDKTCIGVAYGAYSSDLRGVEQFFRNMGMIGPFGNQLQTSETVWELNHWFQLSDWCAITPDIQYIVNPKGFGTIDNALVVGAQIGITF